MWSKGTPFILLVGMKVSAAVLENTMKFPQETKSRFTICSSNPTFEYLSLGIEILLSKGHLYSHVHCCIIHNNHDMEAS